jgi:hypothetical protein
MAVVFTTGSFPGWSFQVGIPNVPLLSGFELMLQAAYAGTLSPIGFDLSNGVLWRFGN